MDTTGSVEIRTVTENDASALLSVYAPYVEKTAISFEYEVPSKEEFAQRIRTVLKKYPYIAAVENGHITGYAYAGAFNTRQAYDHSVEMTVYIEESQRRHGLGCLLYRKMEELLKQQGVLNLNACIGYTPREHDPHLTNASMHFHEHMGFRLVGTFEKCGYKFDAWYDMVWMEKLIGNHTCPAPAFKTFPEIKDSCGIL